MVKISASENCGNSPKQVFLKQFNIAFAEGDNAFIAKHVTEDITWDVVGANIIRGRADFVETLGKLNNDQVEELIISTIITHGKYGSANGEIVMKNGDRYAFCDVYEFKNTKGTHIKSMQSFNIAVK